MILPLACYHVFNVGRLAVVLTAVTVDMWRARSNAPTRDEIDSIIITRQAV